VFPDDKRFLRIKLQNGGQDNSSAPVNFVVVQNRFGELQERVRSELLLRRLFANSPRCNCLSTRSTSRFPLGPRRIRFAQALILNRCRRRAPHLRAIDRFLAGICSLFIQPSRLVDGEAIIMPLVASETSRGRVHASRTIQSS